MMPNDPATLAEITAAFKRYAAASTTNDIDLPLLPERRPGSWPSWRTWA